MPLPPGATRDCFFTIQVRDRLALINSKVTEIWILEDRHKQLWNKHTLNVPPMFSDAKNPIEPICSIGNEILIQYLKSKFFYYDLETKTTRHVPNLSKLVSSSHLIFTSYVESLYPLKEVGLYYEEALAVLNVAPVSQHFDKAWITHVQLKAALFYAEACYRYSLELHEKEEETAEEIACLKSGIGALSEAKKSSSKVDAQQLLDAMNKLEATVNRNLERAMEEKMLDASKEKMFSSLVPDSSANALSRYTEMVDDIIQTQAEKLQHNGVSLPHENNGVSLPQEIIFGILKEIPAKILLRFRCVSKLWLSIINDPLFIESHHNRSINRPSGINLLFVKLPIYEVDNKFYSTDPEGRSVLPLQSLESLPDTAEFLPSPLYSVKGLICFQSCIWNPSTREIHEIPPIRIRSPTFGFSVVDNSFRAVSFNLLGFDPAASGGKHKVLNITEVYNPEDDVAHTQFKVLTLSQGGAASTWRDIDQSSVNSQVNMFLYERNRGCCINDIVYCLGNIGNRLGKYVILSSQVGDESFEIMPLPPGAATRDCFFTIQVRDRLALINSKVSEIWILEDHHNQLWNKHSLNVPPMFSDAKNPIKPICSIGDEILFQFRKSKIFYYDLKTETTRHVPNLSKLVSSSHCIFTSHVESLYPLKESTTVDVSVECAGMLERLMLAQAQECVFENTIAKGSTPGLCAKIYRQVGLYYEEALAALNFAPVSQHFDRAWITHVQLKAALFYAEACYRYSLELHEKEEETAEEIARLKSGICSLSEAKKSSSKGDAQQLLDAMKKFEATVNRNLERAMEEKMLDASKEKMFSSLGADSSAKALSLKWLMTLSEHS
ncbi:uncharacterized protein LOC132302551 isoform X2 [Cornus florida]|uniref:uncharacterized protein LOC132302551 isoform X2 n=1 Tax=Cornus florida TaxID=4283 RepID=UPI0028A171C3|nr:uncharacterized protein LOC132302551 isoform X2 [Cornus florida]